MKTNRNILKLLAALLYLKQQKNNLILHEGVQDQSVTILTVSKAHENPRIINAQQQEAT